MPVMLATLHQQLASNPGSHYAPRPQQWFGWGSHVLDGTPVFSWFDIPRMLRDQQVGYGLAMLRGPFQQIEFKVTAETPDVATFVEATITRFWRRVVPRLLKKYFTWGYAPVALAYEPDGRRMRLKGGRVIEPMDAKPYVWQHGPAEGRFDGFTVPATGGKEEYVGKPHALWFAGHEESGPFYDRPRCSGAFEPWLEKNGRNGAKHSRRQWFRKCAYAGAVMHHPDGTTRMSDGTVLSNQDYARQILELYEAGGNLTIPNTPNMSDPSKYAWDYKPAVSQADVGGVRDYPKDLDREILTGLGIPPEVLEAASAGGGWSGRMIPAIAFYGSIDETAAMLLDCFDEGALRELVRFNFGSVWYECECVPLVETILGNNGNDDPQAPPQMGGDAAAKPGELDPAAAPVDPSQLTPDEVNLLSQAIAAAQAEGDREQVAHLSELADNPDLLRQLLGTGGAAELSWVEHPGTKSTKTRWKDTATGEIRYQKSQPGSRKESTLKATASHGRAKELADHLKSGAGTSEHVVEFAQHVAALNRTQLADLRKDLAAKSTMHNKEGLLSTLKMWAKRQAATADAPPAEPTAPVAEAAPVPPPALEPPPAAHQSPPADALKAFGDTVLAAHPQVTSAYGPAGDGGDHKVFVSHLYDKVKNEPAVKGMSLDQFKTKLVEANIAGHVGLQTADLTQAFDPADLRASAVNQHPSTFHFVTPPRDVAAEKKAAEASAEALKREIAESQARRAKATPAAAAPPLTPATPPPATPAQTPAPKAKTPAKSTPAAPAATGPSMNGVYGAGGPALPKPGERADHVAEATRDAHQFLRTWFKEYSDGLVNMPHLYNEVKKSVPDLTPEEFHGELWRQSKDRESELHVINDERGLDPEIRNKAIHTNDRLYYYMRTNDGFKGDSNRHEGRAKSAQAPKPAPPAAATPAPKPKPQPAPKAPPAAAKPVQATPKADDLFHAVGELKQRLLTDQGLSSTDVANDITNRFGKLPQADLYAVYHQLGMRQPPTSKADALKKIIRHTVSVAAAKERSDA